jgi:hypothetical protein
MHKLEPQHLIAYCPGLVIVCRRNDAWMSFICAYIINHGDFLHIFALDNQWQPCQFTAQMENVIPVLRPVEDFYRAITCNGEEVVPVAELSKVMDAENIKPVKNNGLETILFDYMHTPKMIGLRWESLVCGAVENPFTEQDMQLVSSYFHKYKIDCYNLIDNGLAIDYTTTGEHFYD